MKQLVVCALFGITASFAVTGRGEEIVTAPKGWDDSKQGDQRVVSNGNATVTINPWHSLEGLDAEQWLKEIVSRDPDNGVLLSAESIKPESVPGAYSVMRKAQFGKQTGHAILYLCPGQSGHARLMSLDVIDGGFRDTLKGAMFGESVCKKEPKGTSEVDASADGQQPISETGEATTERLETNGAITSSSDTNILFSEEDLRVLNQQIPAANRPVRAALRLKSAWRGFPATLTHKAVMVPEFKGGYQLSCTDWDPGSELKVADLAGTEECAVEGKETDKSVKGFDSGQRIELAFGNVSAFGIDGLSGSASSISGGDLVMSPFGEIAIGNWQAGYVSNSTAAATSTRKNKSLIGQYYLDGNTITIKSSEGDVHNGFIGYTTSDSGAISALFLNGTHYWKRDK